MTVSDAELKRRGWTKPHPRPTTVDSTAGIDKGWDYNPGRAAWGRKITEQLMGRRIIGEWKDDLGRGPKEFKRPGKTDIRAPAKPLLKPARDEKELRGNFRKAIGGDEATFKDPFGSFVNINQGLVDHIVKTKSQAEWSERSKYFSLIPDIIENPFEIWANFSTNDDTGQVSLRKKYIKGVDVGRGKRIVLIADMEDGMWTGLTFFEGENLKSLKQRRGLLVWPRV
ncbi:MAG: PBECR2 nuclease fold domain-containing protein [Nitrospinales bacterium]